MEIKMNLAARMAAALAALTLLTSGLGFAATTAHKPKAKATQSVARISASQAEKIALAKYPGKIVEKTKLENEEGVWQYSVMIQSGKTLREVMVNAKTGKIDNVEVTTTSKEKTEAQNEAAKEKSSMPSHKGK